MAKKIVKIYGQYDRLKSLTFGLKQEVNLKIILIVWRLLMLCHSKSHFETLNNSSARAK